MKTSEIRQTFIDFFTKKQHQLVPSSPLIPANDPTLLFTNAGMVPFKDTFLGLEPRAYTRAVSSQRCLRAGGKHNDLENVGYTARHHTFFEMLGNFSFGDYFKREAIQYAWEFITVVLKLPAERLWITVYKDDAEAEDIWLNEIKISPQRFSRCGDKDNFWSMGDTGPCGPCTEIFYDHGDTIPGGPPGSPNEEGDRYIEIWNLVFMQFNRDAAGTLHLLPKPSVDTGMGLERIAAIMQGVHNNYDIDLFTQLIAAIIALKPDLDANSSSLKVIADHIRACCFLVCDGVMPGNEGRGYVLRRIIRRAVRHGHKLGIETSFFYKLVAPMVALMGDFYPQLGEKETLIREVLFQEERQFAKTLDQGLVLLKSAIANLEGSTVLSGETLFQLYDTFGFPVDLTEDIAREQGLAVDKDGFEQQMARQRHLSKSSSHFSVDYNCMPQLDIENTFVGYELTSNKTSIQRILKDNHSVASLNKGDAGVILLESTPFYAESGGQIGDTGVIKCGSALFKVLDTQKSAQAIMHIGTVVCGTFHDKDVIEACVDEQRRMAIRLNHTATHLLHAALKKLLGVHIDQKGSLVNDTLSRFDFSHATALSKSQLQAIESLVNTIIRQNLAVVTEEMDMQRARASGAVALFGEKYSDTVRVLSIDNFSKELCGGTHVRQTGDIGVFKIVSEYGVANGVRRIEMVTGAHALVWINEQLNRLDATASLLRCNSDSVLDKAQQLLADNKQLEKTVEKWQQKIATQSGNALTKAFVEVNGVQLLVKALPEIENKALRQTLDQLKTAVQNAVIVLYKIEGDKINVIAGVSKSLIGKVPSAAKLVQHLCGKGGGRADMAQGGGALPEDLQTRLDTIKSMIPDNVT